MFIVWIAVCYIFPAAATAAVRYKDIRLFVPTYFLEESGKKKERNTTAVCNNGEKEQA